MIMLEVTQSCPNKPSRSHEGRTGITNVGPICRKKGNNYHPMCDLDPRCKAQDAYFKTKLSCGVTKSDLIS